MRQPIPMTPGGHKKLQLELKRLKSVERPRIVEEIERALGHGDISENAEYDAAKERQAQLSRKIAQIEDRLSRVQIIDPKSFDHAKVVFGATVRLQDTNSGEELFYQIVGADESDIKEGKISVESPIGKSLIGKKEGDVAAVRTPRGAREFEILEIKYQ